jgi:hypothetical protein
MKVNESEGAKGRKIVGFFLLLCEMKGNGRGAGEMFVGEGSLSCGLALSEK